MKKFATALLVFFSLSTSACYHANIITDQPAGNQVIEKPWFMTFVGGLVVPDEVDVRNECTNGVARVETEHSFMNMIVAGLTGGLVAPITVRVTCAAGANTAEVIKGADEQAVLEAAATRSIENSEAVYVQITAAE